MNLNKPLFRPLAWSLSIALAATVVGCGGGGSNTSVSAATKAGVGTGVVGAGAVGTSVGRGPAPVNLGTAGGFVILAQSAITNVPASAITGDVGLSPGTGAGMVITCSEITGNVYSVDAAGPMPCVNTQPVKLTLAIADKDIAYTDAGSRAPDYTELGAGNLGGLNLGPATYKWSSAVLIPTNVTLTGGPNDVWIFQIAQGLTVSSGVQIILAGGAQAKNVFWQTFGVADIGTTAQFHGIIMSQTSIVMKTGATINGKLLAKTAVTLAQNTVK